MSEKQIIHRKVQEAEDMPPPQGCPEVLAALMQNCLNRQAQQRPTMDSVLSQLHALLATFWPDDEC